MKIFLRSFFLVLLIFITFINVYNLYLFLQNPRFEQKVVIVENPIYVSNLSDADLEQQKLSQVSKLTNDKNIEVIGWIADWGIANAVSEIERKAIQFTAVSPFLFVPNEDGSLKDLQTRWTDRLRDVATANRLKYIATIPLFDADLLSKILNNPESFKRHIESIVAVVEKYNFDGIDLDYESIYISDKRLFFDFLGELSNRIKSKNKKLSFTVIPKWGDYITYNTLPQTRRVQDYKRIADLVDEFRIMTYEFTPRMSTLAGPLAPINWVEKVAQYAISKGVPREKIVLGIHNYAFVWPTDKRIESVNLVSFYSDLENLTEKEVLAFNYEDVEAILNRYSPQIANSDIWQETYAQFFYQGKTRTMFFLSQENVNLRKQLAKDYGLKGVVYWRVGNSGNFVF